MPVILVIIIMVAWLVILGPNLLKRRSRTVGGISSISHFHRQLRVLEHSAPPPLVTPAYRLRAADGSAVEIQGSDGRQLGLPPKLSVVGADQLPRPALAFLGDDPTGRDTDGSTAGGPPVTGGRVLPALARTPPVPTAPRVPDVHARSLARRRRRDTLGVLSAVFTTTALLGFIPGAGMAWLFSVVSGLILIAYVTLLVRIRRTAEERERKLHYLRPDSAHGPEVGTSMGAVGALPLGVTRLPVRVSGRYAHPSNQAAAAR